MRLVRLSLAVLLVGLLATGAWAQWRTTPVEMIFRDGHREIVRASPFDGIAGDEIRLGAGGTYRRSAVRIVCFGACPDAVSGDPAEADVVVRRDGGRVVGPITGADAVAARRSDGAQLAIREIHYILFAEPSVASADPAALAVENGG